MTQDPAISGASSTRFVLPSHVRERESDSERGAIANACTVHCVAAGIHIPVTRDRHYQFSLARHIPIPAQLYLYPGLSEQLTVFTRMITTAAIALAALVPAALAADNAFDAEYYANPWTGVCASGMMQTPIDLPADGGSLPGVPEDLVTNIQMPVITAPVTKNVGSAVQVRSCPLRVALPLSSTVLTVPSADGRDAPETLLQPSE